MQNNLGVNLIPYKLQLLPKKNKIRTYTRYDEKGKKIKFEGFSSLAIQESVQVLICFDDSELSGALNENIVQNHFNILLNVFWCLNCRIKAYSSIPYPIFHLFGFPG